MWKMHSDDARKLFWNVIFTNITHLQIKPNASHFVLWAYLYHTRNLINLDNITLPWSMNSLSSIFSCYVPTVALEKNKLFCVFPQIVHFTVIFC